MSIQFESSCLCGACKVSFTGTPIMKFRCHCTDELRLTGVGFSNNMLLSVTSLVVLAGTFKESPRGAGSGNTITTYFCGECGSLPYRSSDGFPGMLAIKVGCIDDGGKMNREYVPDIEIFTRSRVPWLPAVESATQEVGTFSEVF